MQPAIIATKFHRPKPPLNHVQRPQLVERLNAGLRLGRQVSLISAPAGYGKTTLAAEWLAGVRPPVSWLALDEADNDPLRFYTYFLNALQRVDSGLGRELRGVLKTGQLPPDEILVTTLVNDIAGTAQRFLLALDDYQVISTGSLHKFIGQLIAHQPAQLHLVIVSREDPQLPLAGLRAKNLVTEVRAADLRFSGEETQRFFQDVMGLALSEQNVRSLEGRTEGWVAGLQLAGLSMQSREDPTEFIQSLSGSHRYILGYLTEEVLAGQDEEIQTFLLQTALLARLNGDLCDALTGRQDSAALLERLFNENLFLVPLDDEGRWYRYHHLFGDLLRSLGERLGEEHISQLHRRAAHWYDAHGLGEQAIRHALSAKDYPLAVAYLERYASPLVTRGYARTVEAWMEAIPEAMRAGSPKANMAFAWMHLLRGGYSSIPAFLARVEGSLASGDLPAEDAAALRVEMDALRSNMLHVQGATLESIAHAGRALEAAGPENFYIHGLANLGLGGAYRQAGNFEASVEAYQKAIQASHAAGNQVSEALAASALTLMAIQHGRLHFGVEAGTHVIERMQSSESSASPVIGGVYGALGLIYYEWNRLEGARKYYLRGARLSELSGHNASLIYIRQGLSRLYQSQGDVQAAAREIRTAADLMQFGAPAWLRPGILHQQVRVHLAQDNPLAAEALLRQSGIQMPGTEALAAITHPGEQSYIALLRLVLHRANQDGDLQGPLAGMRLAGHIITEAARGGRTGIVLQTLLLRALLHTHKGDLQAGLADIEGALELGEPGGYVRSFVDEGPPVAALLSQALEVTRRRTYVRQLLAAFSEAGVDETQAAAGLTPYADQALVEPLSERELEVLALIAGGLKYDDIADQLIISVNTVRFHVKSIYGKLNVNNRTQAVESARQLGLL